MGKNNYSLHLGRRKTKRKGMKERRMRNIILNINYNHI
jgi:hypothetical protein